MIRTALVLLAAPLFLSCSDDDGDESISPVIHLGVVQSLSGEGAVYGESGVEGLELAIKEIGASTDLTFNYEIVDDQSSIETGVQAYESFVEDGVTAIIGPSLSRIGFESLAASTWHTDAGDESRRAIHVAGRQRNL